MLTALLSPIIGLQAINLGYEVRVRATAIATAITRFQKSTTQRPQTQDIYSSPCSATFLLNHLTTLTTTLSTTAI
uniref:Uncharacterized protein n=1 Tax=Sphingobacterium sp. (strain 21) TaxID=743722 RepID=F4C4P9_SPHS2